MSCVVGIVYEGNVYIGGDSAGTSDACQSVINAEPKVFRIGEFVIGCAGSFRISQILHYTFTPPPISGDLMRYMVAVFVPALKESLKVDEQKSEDLLLGSRVLVGVRGRLFCIYTDFHVEETLDEYNVIGSADDVALGSLYATRCLENDPMSRLGIALEAAQKYYASVREPFAYVSSAGEQEAMSERLTQVTIVEKEAHKLQPGEVTYANVTYNSNRKDWFIGCPSGNGCIGNLIGHSSTYDRVNRLLTFSPSILCSCGAHYFVEGNQIRWV